MNLFQLRAFDAVAREGSFTRAAARLFISQPAVTGHIKALEEHYQIPLLRRTARRVELTEEGARLAAITRAIFGLVDEAQALLEAGRTDVWDVLTRRFETRLIETALANTRGRRIEAAHKLGIGRNTITRKIQELGLDAPDDGKNGF